MQLLIIWLGEKITKLTITSNIFNVIDGVINVKVTD